MERTNEEIQSVVESYGDMIYRLALHYVRSNEDAEDVVQETLLSFLTHSVPKEREKAWLLHVAVNKSLDILRKRKRQAPLDEGSLNGEKTEISLAEELSKLPVLDREIVYLYYFEGYSSKEIAAMIHKTDSAVRKRLERAKKKLKRLLEQNI